MAVAVAGMAEVAVAEAVAVPGVALVAVVTVVVHAAGRNYMKSTHSIHIHITCILKFGNK